MKKKIIIFNILFPIIWICLLNNFDIVLGQTETPPNPGYRPTVVTTPIPKGSRNTVICPPVEPGYYLTRTPSNEWLLECGHCLPENYPVQTMTPAYEPTNTPFPNNGTNQVYAMTGCKYQINGGGDYVCSSWQPETTYVLTEVDKSYSSYTEQTINVKNSEKEVDYEINFHFRYQLQVAPGPSYTWGYTRYFRFYFKNYNADEVSIDIYKDGELFNFYVLDKSQAVYMPITSGDHSGSIDYDSEYIFDIKVFGSADGTADFQFRDDVDQYIGGVYSRLFTVSYENQSFQETPEFVLWCATIEEEDDSLWFDYDGITFGDIYCVDIGPYSVELLGWEIGLPYIANICVQEVGFGHVVIFGLDVDLDAFSWVIAVAWVLRNIFIS